MSGYLLLSEAQNLRWRNKVSTQPGSVDICKHDCGPLQGQGAKRMRKRRRVGGYNGTHDASSPAAKAAFHETSSPTKQARGTPTPTTIASELAVESRPTVQTYTKIAFDVSINCTVDCRASVDVWVHVLADLRVLPLRPENHREEQVLA